MRHLIVIFALAGLIGSTPAIAGLVTFNIAGSNLGCAYWECDDFVEATGVQPSGDGSYESYDFGVTFTLDTAAAAVAGPEPAWGGEIPAHQRRIYSIDSPGTGLSISVGNITLFSSQFFVAIGSLEPGSDFSSDSYINAFSIYSSYGAADPHFYFNLGYVGESIFSSFSLNELVAAPLSKFNGGLPLNPAGFSAHVMRPDSWNVVGAHMTIEKQSVPEPETFALFGLALAVFGFSRRRKLIESMR